MTQSVRWPGLTGTYEYFPLENVTATGIKSEPGNYMFCVPASNGGLVPVYVGVAENLSDRIPNHEVWPGARRYGQVSVWAHTQANKALREAEERDLIGKWNPPLNTQHRTAATILGGWRG